MSRSPSSMLEKRSGDVGPVCPKSSAPLSTVDNETVPTSVYVWLDNTLAPLADFIVSV